MARIIAGISSSHVPAIGAAIDNGRTHEPYWQRVFSGFEKSKEWMAKTKPDVVIMVYNDHVNAFDFKIIPTFGLGCADEFKIADEGWGARPVPVVKGYPELASHMIQSLVLDEFDMTIVNEMQVDHGLTTPMTLLFGQPKAWPCRVIPLAVNVIQYPAPTGHRCYRLGKAIKKAVDPAVERRVVERMHGEVHAALLGAGKFQTLGGFHRPDLFHLQSDLGMELEAEGVLAVPKGLDGIGLVGRQQFAALGDPHALAMPLVDLHRRLEPFAAGSRRFDVDVAHLDLAVGMRTDPAAGSPSTQMLAPGANRSRLSFE